MKKILIIGCGYIGQEVAKIWTNEGRSVTATTRSPEKLKNLLKVATRSVIIKNPDEDFFLSLVDENDVIVITIAADNPKEYETTYLNTSKILKNLALQLNTPKHLIYTSSTSVYGNHNGQWVDEDSQILAKTDQSKILIETEKNYLFLADLGWDVSILRFTELYGPGREISKRVLRMKGQVLPGTGGQYTNMLHQTDAASAINYALKHRLNGIYNISDDEHPTRKELYDQISDKFRYSRMKWNPEHKSFHSGNKRVSNHKVKSEGFVFHYPCRVLD